MVEMLPRRTHPGAHAQSLRARHHAVRNDDGQESALVLSFLIQFDKQIATKIDTKFSLSTKQKVAFLNRSKSSAVRISNVWP